MNYQIVYTTSALKELFKLPEPDFKKIKLSIDSLSKNPFSHWQFKVRGNKGKII